MMTHAGAAGVPEARERAEKKKSKKNKEKHRHKHRKEKHKHKDKRVCDAVACVCTLCRLLGGGRQARCSGV